MCVDSGWRGAGQESLSDSKERMEKERLDKRGTYPESLSDRREKNEERIQSKAKVEQRS